MRVKAYRNLNKPGVVYSLIDQKTGRVVGYSSDVILQNVELRVQPGGRDRVLREQRKNVHAFAVGDLASVEPEESQRLAKSVERSQGPWEFIRYNPYLFTTFVRAADEMPISEADWVRLNDNGAQAILDMAPAYRRNSRRPSRIYVEEMAFW